MLRITPDRRWPLYGVATVRAIEQRAASALPPHTLMQRAGLAVARLALALAPNARTIWMACGPGNNGGDGLEAAMHLHQWGKRVVVTRAGDESTAPADAGESLRRARAAGVSFAPAPPADWDFAIDALLGIGHSRPLDGLLRDWAAAMSARHEQVLAVDVPSGLDADSGSGAGIRAARTLTLLAAKPGLFTANGRDAAGEVWLHDLGIDTGAITPTAWLAGPPAVVARAQAAHTSHKGSFGDVAAIGGAPGMVGAALLAASAALHGGAGRVYVSPLDPAGLPFDSSQPELMLRAWDTLALDAMHVVCGCGGGDPVRAVLPAVLARARTLVLDADALNAVAADSHLQALLKARCRRRQATVLTPHPLEAARLLECGTADVQADRLGHAQALCDAFGVVVVLKGSGTVIAAPDTTPLINPTGNARLATAGTGDVLAGMITARLANGLEAAEAACSAVFDHGLAADRWPGGAPLTASALARGL